MTWSEEEIEVLSRRFGIKPGCRMQEDYHFPEKRFLAEGYSTPGGYVKDFGVVAAEGRLHVFHIDGRPGERCWATGNEISFGHASTSDYTRWIRHRMPLAVGDRPWESEHIWAPFVYRRQGLYYLFYMGRGRNEAFVSYATSTDLDHWTRWPQGPIRCAVGRDPFVFDHGDQTILLYTGKGGARVSACTSRDLVSWKPIPDVLNIPHGAAAESCSLHPIDGRYVLWFNDYGPQLAGFRAAYVLSDDPFCFDPAAIRAFQFVTDAPGATPSPELRVQQLTPLSIELIAAGDRLWFVAYFRWHIDRNRLFFGALDWASDPGVIREIGNEEQLEGVLAQVGIP
ncbi:MAG: hypothetical protein K8T26_16350 [Lentisphaerae bacterium]|nr:hypothetical protein [Lentisphaerota bacterium]